MPPLRNWVDPQGIPVTILTRASQGRRKHVVFALRVAWQLWKRRNEYDVVFFSMFGLHLAAGLPVARLTGKRILNKVHGSTITAQVAQSFIGRRELSWMAKWSSCVMVLNDEMVEEALAAGIPREKIMHMPNPVDTDAFAPVSADEKAHLRERLGVFPSAKVLLYTGRLSKEKGLRWLIDAFALAAPQAPQAQLVLVGDGPIRADLEAQAAASGLGPEQIRFVGRVPSHEVVTWLRIADAFTLVSPNEGFSCALTEAMSTGLPAVVSAIPANVQLIENGVHGYTAPAGDIPATAEAIQRLLNQDSRTHMGLVARQRVLDNYSIDQILERYETLLKG